MALSLFCKKLFKMTKPYPIVLNGTNLSKESQELLCKAKAWVQIIQYKLLLRVNCERRSANGLSLAGLYSEIVIKN